VKNFTKKIEPINQNGVCRIKTNNKLKELIKGLNLDIMTKTKFVRLRAKSARPEKMNRTFEGRRCQGRPRSKWKTLSTAPFEL
jgi:hypothetical protein